jgi:hypothetical protein
LGLAFTGGGHAAFTVSTAVVAALSQIGLLDKVAYVSGNSGGTFTLSGLHASQSYYEAVTDPDLDIEEFIAKTFARYSEYFQKYGRDHGAFVNHIKHVLVNTLHLDSASPTMGLAETLPYALDWQNFETISASAFLNPAIMNNTHTETPWGHQVTRLWSLSMPPDVWTPSGIKLTRVVRLPSPLAG